MSGYVDQGGLLVVDGAAYGPDEVEYDMYTGQPEYYEPLQDQSLRFEPAPAAWSVQSEAPVAGMLDDENHLQMEDMYGVQTRYFDITMDASLSDCAKNRNNAIWKMSPELLQFMQQVVTNKDRTNAKSEDRAGNLERVIPLAATIVEVYNEHDVPIGVNIPGFVPNKFTSKGRYLWTLQPRTAPTQVEYKVCEPDNFLTARMYKNWRKCDLDQLNREIKFNEECPNEAQMRTDGIAFEVLLDGIQEKRFGNKLNASVMADAANYSRWIEVDRDIAELVYNSIATPLTDINKRFMNFKDFHARFQRADGMPFDSPHGRISSPVNGVSTGFMDTHFRYTKKRAGICLRIDFVPCD